MATQNPTMERSKPFPKTLLLFLLPPTALIIGILLFKQPLLALAAVVALPAVYALFVWPETATLAVIFILYTNTADIAVEFHGVPYLVGTSFFLLLGIPLFYHLVLRREKLIIHPAVPWICLFGMIQVIGAALSTQPEISVPKVLEFMIEGAAIFVLVTNVVRTPATLRRACWTMIAAGVLMAAVPLYQQVTGSFHNNYGGFGQVSDAAFDTGERTLAVKEIRQPRLSGSIGEQNRFAQVMLMLVPIGLFRWWSEPPGRLRLIAMLATALIAVGVVLSFSRGAAVGFGVMLLVMAYMRDITRKQLAIVLCGMLLLLVAIPQYATRLAKLKGVWGLVRPSSITADNKPDSALRGRAREMAAAGKMVLEHPLIGVGPGMFRYHYVEYSKFMKNKVSRMARESHNLYLGIAAENGILGLTCFLVIIYITLRNLVRVRGRLRRAVDDRALTATGFLLAIVTYLATGIGLHFAFVRFFWLVMALAAVAGMLAVRRQLPQTTPAD